MKFAFLPNYFKKIGLVCFFASLAVAIVSTIVIIASSFHQLEASEISSQSEAFGLGYKMGTDFAMTHMWIPKLKGILLILSMAFYMLAKEKVDDEYMDAVRWQSLRLALIVALVASILAILVDINVRAHVILAILFIVYLITFKIKKSRLA